MKFLAQERGKMASSDSIEKSVFRFMESLDCPEPNSLALKSEFVWVLHLWDGMSDKEREIVVDDPFVAGAIQLFTNWRDMEKEKAL